jgi:hypothetical protein
VLLEPYDAEVSLVKDYIEIFVQWGYLVLFGAACPLVVVFAFFTNFVETRTDGYKLLHEYRRVIPNRVDGIGEPLNVFYKLLHVSIAVNAGLIAYSFGVLDGLGLHPDYRVWCGLGFVCFMVLVLQGLEAVWPDMPEKTEIQLERQRLVYERVIKKVDVDEDGYTSFALDKDMLGKSIRQINKEKKKALEADPPKVTVVEICDGKELPFTRKVSMDANPSSAPSTPPSPRSAPAAAARPAPVTPPYPPPRQRKGDQKTPPPPSHLIQARNTGSGTLSSVAPPLSSSRPKSTQRGHMDY